MVVEDRRLVIKCQCISQDTKRLLNEMVHSHNAHIANRLKEIREEVRFNKEFKVPRSYDFTEAMLDREADLLIEQKLMEDLQDLFDDLPTC